MCIRDRWTQPDQHPVTRQRGPLRWREVVVAQGDGEYAAVVEVHAAGGGVERAGVEVQPDEPCDVLGRRLAGDLSWGALLDDAAVLDDQEAVSYTHLRAHETV